MAARRFIDQQEIAARRPAFVRLAVAAEGQFLVVARRDGQGAPTQELLSVLVGHDRLDHGNTRVGHALNRGRFRRALQTDGNACAEFVPPDVIEKECALLGNERFLPVVGKPDTGLPPGRSITVVGGEQFGLIGRRGRRPDIAARFGFKPSAA